MPTRVYPIDWREEFEQLAPYLDGQGGIVRICFPSRRCALPNFLETLKCEYECKTGSSAWRSIRIDAQVYSVRFLEGVRDVFCRKLGFTVNDQPITAGHLSRILEGAEADEIDLDLSNVTVSNFETGRALHEGRTQWVARLCDYLPTFLSTNHFDGSCKSRQLERTRRILAFLWSDGLDRLVNSGLFLVHVVDISDNAPPIHEMAPMPHEEVHLPAALGRMSQKHAVADITNWFGRRCPHLPDATIEVIAQTLVNKNFNDIERLHAMCSRTDETCAAVPVI